MKKRGGRVRNYGNGDRGVEKKANKGGGKKGDGIQRGRKKKGREKGC